MGNIARIRKNLPYLGFGTAFILLLLVSGFGVTSLAALINSVEMVTLSIEVIDEIEYVQGYITDAETAQRGYLITGDESYLAPYQAAVAPEGLSAHLRRLRDLSTHYPSQLERLDTLEGLIREKLAFLQSGIDVRQTQGFEAAREQMTDGNGREVMEAIRQMLVEMDADEDRRLEARTAEAGVRFQEEARILVTGGVVGFGLSLWGIVQLYQQIAQRRKAELALQAFNDDLELRVAERTIELEQSNQTLARTNRALATLSGANLALVRAGSEQDLLDNVCRNIVEQGGYRMAAVGFMVAGQTPAFRLAASAGVDLGALNIFASDLQQRLRPALIASVQTGKLIILNRLQDLLDLDTSPVEVIRESIELATQAGCASVIVLPLSEPSGLFGSLHIYAAEPDAFHGDELPLLSELAEDLAYGIRAQRTRVAREQAEHEVAKQLQRLSILREIDVAIMASTELSVSLRVILRALTTQLPLDAADVLLVEPASHTLRYVAGQGFRTTLIERTRLRLDQGLAGRAALHRQRQHVTKLAAPNKFLRTQLIVDEKFVEYYGFPLVTKGVVTGVLEVFHRQPINAGLELLDFIEALAAQAAIAIDNDQLFRGLQRSNMDLTLAYDDTIEGWSRALDLRDKETEGHTQRVTDLTVQMARAFQIEDSELVHIRRGALLHDIGKMGVPDAILLKPDKLTEEEWVVMRLHPVYAFEMLSPISYLRQALDIPYCHHEKWDGTGYPRGLKGDEIPLAARLFAVVDVWDALRSDRPYRAAWPRYKVVEHIQGLAGTHLEPAAVELFLRVVAGS